MKKSGCPFSFKYQKTDTKTNDKGYVIPITVGKPYVACGLARKLGERCQPVIMRCPGGENCPIYMAGFGD